MSTPDSILLEQWQRQRDADAFTELVQRHSDMVFSCCRRMLGDRILAEDITQECFLALMQSGDSVRVSLGAWLHTMAVRRSIDRIKGDARRRKRETTFVAEQPAAPVPDVSLDEILSHVDEAIAELPDVYRAAVVGRFLENQAHTDLARELGVAESTIRYRVDMGVERVRQTLRRKRVMVTAAALISTLSRGVEAAPATLVARLGKLAMSGSVGVPGVTFGSAALTLKVVSAFVAILMVGGIVWFGIQNQVHEKSSVWSPAPGDISENADITEPIPDAAQAGPAIRPSVLTGAAVPTVSSSQDQKPFSIRGRIYDAKTGAGIAGVRANVYPAGGGAYVGRSELSDENGRYFIPPIGDGMYSVNLGEIEGYPDPRGSRHISVTLKNGKPVTGIDFPLEPGIPVSGMVINADGEPVADAEVAAAIATTPNAIRTSSDKQGLFKLYMPEVSDQLRVQAQTNDAESSVEGTFPLAEDGLEGVVLMLDRPKTASLSGVVIDASGNAIAGAQLHLVRKDGSVLHYGTSGEAEKDGRFHITGLPSAEFGVVVTPKGVNGYSTAEEYLRIHPKPGEALEGIEIVYGEKEGMAISGHVVDTKVSPSNARASRATWTRGWKPPIPGLTAAF